MSDQQIRLVLDITAVLAFTRGSDDVGETITQVRENGDAFTAGVLTLAAVRSAARTDFAHLDLAPGSTPDAPPTLGGAPSLLLGKTTFTQAPSCSCTAPTAALTSLANITRVRTRNVTTIVTVPAGLPVTNHYNVAISPLSFHLINDCDYTLGVFVEDSEIKIRWADDRPDIQEADFDDMRAFDMRQIPQFGRNLTDVTMANNLLAPGIEFEETIQSLTTFLASPSGVRTPRDRCCPASAATSTSKTTAGANTPTSSATRHSAMT